MKPDVTKRRMAYNLFLEGKGYKFAAKELNINEHTARDWFRRFRAGPSASESLLSETTNTKRYPMELREKAIELRHKGMSWTEILDATGVPPGTIKNWVKKIK